jgi:hypothetical protein
MKPTIVVRENDLAREEWPPFPYIYWSPDAIKKRLRLAGIDFSKPIARIRDHEGSRWVQ